MRIVNVKQGSPEWRAARLGVVTASRFDDVVTPATLKPTSKARSGRYLRQLVAEVLLGRPLDDEAHDWRLRGLVMEAEARGWYAIETGIDPVEVGFVLRDDGRVGCSPDALAGDEGGVELKIPKADVHVGYLLDPDSFAAEYRGQVQGGLYVTGRKWWDLVSYNPALPSLRLRILPDPAYFEAAEEAIDVFLSDLYAALAQLRPLADRVKSSNPFLL